MELKIDRGIKSYDIVDTDGHPAGTIRLNPADPGLAGRWEAVEKELEPYKNTDISIGETVELDKRIKEKIDYALGSPVSGVLFGGLSCFAMCEDGKLVFEHILDALSPLIEEAQTNAAKAAEERIKQRTDAYEGSAVGLAPGQTE